MPGPCLVREHDWPVRPQAAIVRVRLAACRSLRLPGGSLPAARARPCHLIRPLRLVRARWQHARGRRLPGGRRGCWRQSPVRRQPARRPYGALPRKPLTGWRPGRIALAAGFQLVNPRADGGDALPDLLSALPPRLWLVSHTRSMPRRKQLCHAWIPVRLLRFAPAQVRRARSGPGLWAGPRRQARQCVIRRFKRSRGC